MFTLKVRDIYDVLKPLHLPSQYFGISSFEIKRENEVFSVSIKFFNVFCILFATVGNIICTFTCASRATSLNGLKNENQFHLSEVYQKSMCCILFAFLTLSTIGNWWILSTRKYFCRSLNLLTKIDQELEKLEYPMNFKFQKLAVVSVIASTFMLTTVIITLSNIVQGILSDTKMGFITVISFSICIQRFVLVNCQIICWIWLIKMRFKRLNDLLKKEFPLIENKDPKNGNFLLNKTAELHGKLVDVCDCFNKCYGFPVCCLQYFEE